MYRPTSEKGFVLVPERIFLEGDVQYRDRQQVSFPRFVSNAPVISYNSIRQFFFKVLLPHTREIEGQLTLVNCHAVPIAAEHTHAWLPESL